MSSILKNDSKTAYETYHMNEGTEQAEGALVGSRSCWPTKVENIEVHGAATQAVPGR